MIYKMNYSKSKKLLKEFNSTLYGKIMLIICYTPFLFGFALTLMSLILSYRYVGPGYEFVLMGIVLFTVVSFCIGTYSFYKELRIYVSSRK